MVTWKGLQQEALETSPDPAYGWAIPYPHLSGAVEVVDPQQGVQIAGNPLHGRNRWYMQKGQNNTGVIEE